MCCGGECSALRWLMLHAAVAVAPRCADGVNKFDIPFHEIDLPLPSILVFVPTNSVSRFYEFSRSFLWNQSPAFTNSHSCFHRFCRSFPRIQIPASTNPNIPFREFKLPLLRILTLAFTDSIVSFHESKFPLSRIPNLVSMNSSDIPPHECRKTKKTSF